MSQAPAQPAPYGAAPVSGAANSPAGWPQAPPAGAPSHGARPQATLVEPARPAATAPEQLAPARTLSEGNGGISAGKLVMIVGGASLGLGVIVGIVVILFVGC